ncbi:MAG: hypothetical protein ACXQS5_06775 [Candidatus Methanospirareceae archaeon]
MAEEGVKVKILDIRTVPSVDPERLGKLDTLVTYQVDNFRVYVLRIPKEEVSEEDLKKYIKEDLEKKKRFVGRELTV